MNFDDATGLLNAERYLGFHGLRAGPAYGHDDTALSIEVDGADVSGREVAAGTGDDAIDRILGPVRAIETGPGSLRYTLRFDPCIAYTWRDESYVIPERDEDFTRKLRHYDQSAFLDYVTASTFAAEAAGYPLEHFAIVTLDAVIDVICRDAPQVTARMLDPDDPGPLPGGPSAPPTDLPR
ncbi:hypothetical protein [Gymnodinialimonas ulvae]|uniref:hypothetical protein n=1 Tax=Gymnodinialimonas ulvae TaxID=3126504 RepID=UPI0030A13E9D